MINKHTVVGYLRRDPEVRFTPSGRAVAKFSVATTEKWTDQQGQKQEKTEWHNIVVWGKQAETCGQYLTKGSLVYVEGKSTNRSWDDKDGNKRYITELVARDVKFLPSGNGASNRPARAAAQGDHSAPQGEDSFTPPPAGDDDDIPF